MANRSILKLLSAVFLFGFAVITSDAQTICGSIQPEYSTLGSRWKAPIHLVLNPTGMPDEVRIEDVQSAIDAWTRFVEVEITLSVDLTATGGNVHDGVSVISFGPHQNAGVLGATFNSVNGNEITESDILFYENEALSRPGQFASLLCHEIGHALGLGHSLDLVAMMNPVAHGQERGATLALDDRAAIQFVYPPKASSGPAVTKAKAKNSRLVVTGDMGEAVTVWINGETYEAKHKGGNVVIKGDFPMVGKGFNVLVVNTPAGSSDPFFF